MTDLLVVDIGNTTTRLGLWGNALVQETSIIPTGETTRAFAIASQLMARGGASSPRAARIALSAVVPQAEAAWQEWCHQAGRPLFLVRGDTPTALINRYHQPETLGPDRLAAAVGAVRRLGAPAIVVSLGTATVVDAVSELSEFLGGAVAVGVDTGLAALAERTASLPRVSAKPLLGPIGRDAETCLQSGATFGAAGLVEGLVARLRRVVGPTAPVALTGGHADLISTCIKARGEIEHQVFPTLILEGVAAIWEHNQERGAGDADR